MLESDYLVAFVACLPISSDDRVSSNGHESLLNGKPLAQNNHFPVRHCADSFKSGRIEDHVSSSACVYAGFLIFTDSAFGCHKVPLDASLRSPQGSSHTRAGTERSRPCCVGHQRPPRERTMKLLGRRRKSYHLHQSFPVPRIACISRFSRPCLSSSELMASLFNRRLPTVHEPKLPLGRAAPRGALRRGQS